MPPRRRTPPADLCPGWPDATCEDARVERLRLCVLALRQALRTRSARSLAAEIGLGRTTISEILSGKVWPDTHTLASLEVALGTRLWPSSNPSHARND